MALFGSSVALAPLPAFAEPPVLWGEMFAGADVCKNSWITYSGVTVAPYGHIHADGWRLRAGGGYGRYDYEKLDGPAGAAATRTFDADTYFADLMVGYQSQFGPVTAKIFVGAAAIGHRVTPLDDENIVVGDDFGFKAATELWINLGPIAWASLDVAYTTAHETLTSRARLGYRIVPAVSVGLEAGLNVDEQGECRMNKGCATLNLDNTEPATYYDYSQIGVFTRYEWQGGEISVSAGAAGAVYSDSGDDVQLYGTVNWNSQF